MQSSKKQFRVLQTFLLGVPVFKLQRKFFFVWWTVVDSTTDYLDITGYLNKIRFDGNVRIVNKSFYL